MNEDLSLQQEDVKLILLICGDSQTGKKTIVKCLINNRQYTKKEYSTYKSYFFKHEEVIRKATISIPIELRILNSEELETKLKLNKAFFADALGAFVVNSITDNNSFINGEKWKDKLDLMCCLPNRYPLPIFLLINKCDQFNENQKEKDNEDNINTDKIETYSMQNQFFNTFLLGLGKNDDNNDNIINADVIEENKINDENKNIIEGEENIKDLIVNPIIPFEEMINILMGFKDIRNQFIAQSGGVINDNDNFENTKSKSKKCILI